MAHKSTFMWMRFGLALLIGLPLASCSSMNGESEVSIAPTPAPTPAWEDPATGAWKGDWYFKMGESSLKGGMLECVVTREEEDLWNAIFTAQWGMTNANQGQTGSYTVSLEGRRQGDTVVFGGSVNLGSGSGGVFEWTGTVSKEKFLGVYDNPNVKGTFEMIKVEEDALEIAETESSEPTE